MAIEVGPPYAFPGGAVLLHSTESGQFMAASKAEFAEFAAAIRAGVFDAVLDGTAEGASSAEVSGG